MEHVDTLTRDLPMEYVYFVRYESLCSDPKGMLGGHCEFLGVGMSETMLRRATEYIHNIGDSPSKFDKDRTAISLDRSFEDHLDEEQHRLIATIAGATAAGWGYCLQ
jgi:hypothetical protein